MQVLGKNKEVLGLELEIDGLFKQLPIQSDAGDAEYWCNANTSLVKGYELSVPMQNTLDEINESLSEQFRRREIDVSTLTQEDFKSLVQAVDLTRLGGFISYKGVDHHYFVESGMGSQAFRLDIDLKCIPTSIDSHGNVVASIAFISGKLTVGDVVFQDVAIKYIGPKNLEELHLMVIKYGCHATNHQLGKWLRYVRSLAVGESPIYIGQAHTA